MSTLPSLDAIRSRTSIRKYEPRPLDPAAHALLDDVLASASATGGPLGSAVRLALLAASEEDQEAIAGLITYGFVRHAPAFIVGAVARERWAMEDYGYVLEMAVLRATEAGLGTCWLGGTFNHSAFAERVELATGELIPAVLAVGHPASKRGLLERAIRAGAKAHTRKPWEALFFDQGFERPLVAADAGSYATALEMVRIGPSASNKQPWRVVREGAAWHFFVQRNAMYGTMMRSLRLADLQRVDLGIAMCHFEVAARNADQAGAWEERPPQLAAPAGCEYVISWCAE